MFNFHRKRSSTKIWTLKFSQSTVLVRLATINYTLLSEWLLCHAGTSPTRSHLSVWSLWEGRRLRLASGGPNLLHSVVRSLCYTRGNYSLLGKERDCTGNIHCCQRWRLMTFLLMLVHRCIIKFLCLGMCVRVLIMCYWNALKILLSWMQLSQSLYWANF